MNRSFRLLLDSRLIRQADLLMFTGDITDRGDLASWQEFSSSCLSAGVADKILVLPGNHDVCCLGARLPGKRQAYRQQDLMRVRRGLQLALRLLCVTHRVRLLVHGHLHLAEDRKVAGVRIAGAPASTQPVKVGRDHAHHQVYAYTVERRSRRVRVELKTIEIDASV